jgi:hypothetical protein
MLIVVPSGEAALLGKKAAILSAMLFRSRHLKNRKRSDVDQLRQIRYFVSTAEHGQVSQAALDLAISQSAITTAI